MRFCVFFLILLLINNAIAEIKITTDFEGGSAKDFQVIGNSISFKPGGIGERGFTCWWYVKLEDVSPDHPLQVTVDAAALKQSGDRAISSDWALPDRLSYSIDNKTWQSSETGVREKNKSQWSISNPSKILWLAWGPPYVPSHSKNLAAELRSDICTPFILCKTKAEREVQALKITSVASSRPKKVIWLQARQHAWESGSSWVGEGIVRWMTGDSEEAVKLLEQTIVYYIPIMDVDNVVTGNGGKEQMPHDHNRDWSEKPHWNSVAAAQKLISQHAEKGEMSLFIDLHNPAPADKETYLFVSPQDVMGENRYNLQLKLIEALKKNVTDPIPFNGQVKVSGKGYHSMWQQISKTWFNTHANDDSCGVTIEIPWNSAGSNQRGYLKTGANIGHALAAFMKEK